MKTNDLAKLETTIGIIFVAAAGIVLGVVATAAFFVLTVQPQAPVCG